MGYRVVDGDGLRTRFEGNPAVSVNSAEDGPLELALTFQTTSAKLGEIATLTRLTFDEVVEYRWIAFDQAYDHGNRDDFEFGLIEIIDSQQVEALLSGGMRRDQIPGDRFAHHLVLCARSSFD